MFRGLAYERWGIPSGGSVASFFLSLSLIFLPIQEVTVFAGMSLYEVSSIAFITYSCFLWSSGSNKTSISVVPAAVFLYLFAFFVFISLAWNREGSFSFSVMWSMALPLAFSLFSLRNVDLAYKSVFCSALFLALIVIGQKFSVVPVPNYLNVAKFGSNDPFSWGYTGLISTRGTFGITLITGLACGFISDAVYGHKRILMWGMYVVFLIAAVFSLSRSTLFSIFIFGMLVMFFSLSQVKIRYAAGKKTSLLPIGLVGAVIFLIIFGSFIASLISDFINIRPETVSIRMSAIRQGMSLISDNIWFGAGKVSGRFLEHSIHNAYIAVLVERGFFAFGAFVALNIALMGRLIFFAYKLDIKTSRQAYILLSAFLAVQVEMFFFQGYNSLSYWAFVALCLVVIRRLRVGGRHLPNSFGLKYAK